MRPFKRKYGGDIELRVYSVGFVAIPLPIAYETAPGVERFKDYNFGVSITEQSVRPDGSWQGYFLDSSHVVASCENRALFCS